MLSGNGVKTVRCSYDPLCDPLRLKMLSGNGALDLLYVIWFSGAGVTLNLYRLPNLYRARHPYVIHSKPAWQQMIASSVAWQRTIASNDVKGSRTFANLQARSFALVRYLYCAISSLTCFKHSVYLLNLIKQLNTIQI